VVDTVGRLFVALIPPADVLEPLARAVDELRPRAPALSWTPSGRWHLTLAFLGEVTDDTAPALTERLARVARRHGPLPVEIAGGGRFGDRVLWARVSVAAGPLAAGLVRAAGKAGVTADDRPLRPHLTVARSRRNHAVDLRPLAEALAEVRCPPWTASDLHLVRSHLGPSPRYETVGSWPLLGPPGR
jgi:2'-5' RNA ligase